MNDSRGLARLPNKKKHLGASECKWQDQGSSRLGLDQGRQIMIQFIENKKVGYGITIIFRQGVVFWKCASKY